jgi:uncharacterized protein YndB with AHSA1/START domain
MASSGMELTNIPDVKVEMVVRKPPEEVFRAFVDPEVTTRFWFTKSDGKMTPGAHLRWDWEMYGVSTGVEVLEIDENNRILFRWDDDQGMTVELRFTPWDGGATHVAITESGFEGTANEAIAWMADSTGGFTIMICALKALLERDVELNAVRDAHPEQLRL